MSINYASLGLNVYSVRYVGIFHVIWLCVAYLPSYTSARLLMLIYISSKKSSHQGVTGRREQVRSNDYTLYYMILLPTRRWLDSENPRISTVHIRVFFLIFCIKYSLIDLALWLYTWPKCNFCNFHPVTYRLCRPTMNSQRVPFPLGEKLQLQAWEGHVLLSEGGAKYCDTVKVAARQKL